MSVHVLRLGAVQTETADGQRDATTNVDSELGDGELSHEEYYAPVTQTYPGCFGLPYQDHNYGAPPPPTPPPSPPPPVVIPEPEVVSNHVEVEEVVPPVAVVAATGEAKEISVEDDSITRCICDYRHDDGYMICCDKCSVWQHIDCMAVDRSNIPESYFCEICEPRYVDKERARQLQTKRKELLIDTDSSATDTDPEEVLNRQMSQQLNNTKKGKNKKKNKVKGGDNKNLTTPGKVEGKVRKSKEKKDVKKEKENKEADKKQKSALKEAISKKINKSKINKKPGLTLVINENAQDPWDSSYSPWVDKYEEASLNHYTPEVQTMMSLRLNGQHTNEFAAVNGKLLAQLCHVTEVNKNRKGLEASETIGEGEPIIEYTGKVMLKQQFDKEHFFKLFNPFVLFYKKIDSLEICVDATSYGNNARFIRRSCKANAEVRHVINNGGLTLYIVSAKVIPRGSEITIPYDYSYKECSYCVECACLRSNCPVAKYFKRKNAQHKKDKLPKSQKSPIKAMKSPIKSPVRSPVRSPVKSPIKLNLKKMPDTPVKVEPVKEETSATASSQPSKEALKEIQTEKCDNPVVKQEEKPLDHSGDSNSGLGPCEESMSDEESHTADKGHKKTREERKMEAIMKAFEKMEKRQERRKEALARIDHSKSESDPKGNKEKDSNKEKVEKEQTVNNEKTLSDIKEDVKTVEDTKDDNVTESVSVKESINPIKDQQEKPVEKLPVEVKTEVVTKRETRPKAQSVSSRKKPKKAATRRKSRMSSTCSSEMSLSVDENSCTSSSVPSCPATPLATPTSSATIVLPNISVQSTMETESSAPPPSFKFLKTKKHLMSEWLNEKTQVEGTLITSESSKGKTDPLEVSVINVDDAMFVTCLPSPRNSMEHWRRNSQGSAMPARQVTDNSAGSAKKRWLRQAMSQGDKPEPEACGSNTCMSPVAGPTPSGPLSPNPMTSMPSPGASPPGDFVTPLKKRRLARESLDQPIVYTPSTSTPTSAAVVSSAEDLRVSASEEDNSKVSPDTQGFKPSLFKPTPVTPGEDESICASRFMKKGWKARRIQETSTAEERDSFDSDTSNSVHIRSPRVSFDLSDLEHETTSTSDVLHMGKRTRRCNSSSNNSDSNIFEKFSEVRTSVDTSSNSSVKSSRVCQSSTIDNTNVCLVDGSKDSGNGESVDIGECDSIASNNKNKRYKQPCKNNSREVTRGKEISELMEVDSTEDSSRGELLSDNSRSLCDSTSTRGWEKKLNACVMTPLNTEQSECASTSNTTDSEVEVSHYIGIVEVNSGASVVDSSTDQSLDRATSAVVNSANTETISQADNGPRNSESVLLADQSTDSDCRMRESVVNSQLEDSQVCEQVCESLVESVSESAVSHVQKDLSSLLSSSVADTSGDNLCRSSADTSAETSSRSSNSADTSVGSVSRSSTSADTSAANMTRLSTSAETSIENTSRSSSIFADTSTENASRLLNSADTSAEKVGRSPISADTSAENVGRSSVSADTSVENVKRFSSSTENVGSSSDDKHVINLFDVSSSSELRNSELETVTVGSSQSVDNNIGVSSTGHVFTSEPSSNNLVTGGTADSSEAAFSSKVDLEDSNNSEDNVQHSTYSEYAQCSGDISGTPIDHSSMSSDTDSIRQEEIASSSTFISSALLDDSSNFSSSSFSQSTHVPPEPPEPPPPPPPSKKKVSLLEYRKRLKEKSTPNGSSSSASYPSSSSPCISSSASVSSSTSPSLSPSLNSLSPSRHHKQSFNKPSSSGPRSSIQNSRHLPSLPSLPLFDSSPSKDPALSSRHQFKSSSDLVRRKSAETKKREKPLSLTERLKMEFGIDEAEEEKEKEKDRLMRHHHHHQTTSTNIKSRPASSHTPPPPPPPPSRSTPELGTTGYGQDQGQECHNNMVQPSIQQQQQHHNFQQPMFHGQVPLHPGQPIIQSVPQPVPPPDHQLSQHMRPQNPVVIRGPSPGMMPPHSLAGQNTLPSGTGMGPTPGMMPPQTLPVSASQSSGPGMMPPQTLPGSASQPNGPVMMPPQTLPGSASQPNGPVMMPPQTLPGSASQPNGPGMIPPHMHAAVNNGPGPNQTRPMGKIPSLLSLQTFPPPKLQGTSNTGNSNSLMASQSPGNPTPQMVPPPFTGQNNTENGMNLNQLGIMNPDQQQQQQQQQHFSSGQQQQQVSMNGNPSGYEQTGFSPVQQGFVQPANGTNFNMLQPVGGPQQQQPMGSYSSPQQQQHQQQPQQQPNSHSSNGPLVVDYNHDGPVIHDYDHEAPVVHDYNHDGHVVHDYNHGYNNSNDGGSGHKRYQHSPSYHSQNGSQGSMQRKSKNYYKKQKRKSKHKLYSESGSLY